MSSEWVSLTLDDVCLKITDGAHQSPKSVEKGRPMCSVKDLTEFGLNIETARHISVEDFDTLVRQGCMPIVGDVLIAKDGNSALDTVCSIDEPVNAVLLSSVAILRPDPCKIDTDFLKYYFKSSKTIDYLKNNFISGAAIPRVVLRDFKKAEILLPDLNKQKAISKILRSIDDKINLNSKVNQTLEQMAQTIFKSWFVDFEPVKAKIAALEAGGSEDDALLAAMQAIAGSALFATDAAGADAQTQLARLQAEHPEQYATLRATAELFPSAMQESELGEIPEGWECMPLDEVAHYQNGLALQKYRPENEDDFLPVLKIAQLRAGYADGNEKASPNIRKDCIVNNGDIIFSWSGSLIVDVWCGGKAALNQHLFKVTSEEYPKWLYYYFTCHHLEEFQRIAAAKAVTMGHIKREHLRQALCAIPANELIKEASKILGNILDKEIALKLQIKSLSELRDTLLPKLLSGELSVSAAADQITKAEEVVNVQS